MKSEIREARRALLSLIFTEGPLYWLRRYQECRQAFPECDPGGLAEKIAQRGSSARGASREDWLAQRDISWMTLLDQDYPSQLRVLDDPPLVLFYRGQASNLFRPGVALVGSRKCTLAGRQVARQLSGALAGAGFVINSGLALGIDAAAHRACLDVNGRTVAVLGAGLENLYPRVHTPLAEDVVAFGGTLVSEFPPFAAPRKHHFPVRNRLISGLSCAVAVVEAGERSGSLITARYALDQGRQLYAVPGPIYQKCSLGTNKLIANGEAQLLTCVSELVAELKPLLGKWAVTSAQTAAVLSCPLAQRVYGALDPFVPIHVDRIHTVVDSSPGQLIAALLRMEAMGYIERWPGQRYVRNLLVAVEQEQE